MRGGIRLGSYHGAPIVADGSAFILVLLFAVAMLLDLRTSGLGSSATDWIVAIVAGVVLMGCILGHELAHAIVANRLGLNVRAIRLYVFGGYSVIDGRASAGAEFAVSVVGPLASLLFAGLFYGASVVVGPDDIVGRSLAALALMNLAIGLFNLLPGFPLDGGRMIRGILAAMGRDRVQATRAVTRIGQITGYLAIGAGIVITVRMGFVGLLVIAVGWFLSAAAASAGRREQLSAAFDGLTVRDAMRATPDAISGNATVSTILDLYTMGPRLKSLPVEIDGRVVGVIGQDEIDAVAPSRWPSIRARSVMAEIGPADVVDAAEPLDTLMMRPAGPSRRVVVVDGGVTIGIIEGADLERVLPA